MIWILMILVLSGCAQVLNEKPEPPKCFKVWDKKYTQSIIWECERASQSTRDGER